VDGSFVFASLAGMSSAIRMVDVAADSIPHSSVRDAASLKSVAGASSSSSDSRGGVAWWFVSECQAASI
jgi:hypothetical protein